MQPAIMFTVQSDVDNDKRDELLAAVRRLSGVEIAGALKPNSKSASVRRMCFARTRDESVVGNVLEALRRLPGIETAELPAERELMSL